MLPSRRAALVQWIFIFFLGIGSLQSGVGNDLPDCDAYLCCEDDCCGPDTIWDASIEYCVPSPGASGFVGVFEPEYVPVCSIRICCEDSCCFRGTYYEPSVQSCLPLTIPTAAPVAPTPSPTASPGARISEAPTQLFILPSPAFRPNVCGVTLQDAAALCKNTTTCDQAESDEDCYEPCDFFDPSACPEGEACFSFVSGCKDFAPSFPDVPFDPSIFP